MVSEFEVALSLLLGSTAVLSLTFLWIAGRIIRLEADPSNIDPILGGRDRVAIYKVGGPFVQPHPNVLISMPDQLMTKDEMVVWMTKDLPTMIEDATRFPS